MLNQTKISTSNVQTKTTPIKSFLYQAPVAEQVSNAELNKEPVHKTLPVDPDYTVNTKKKIGEEISQQVNKPVETIEQKPSTTNVKAVTDSKESNLLSNKKVLESALSTKTFTAIDAINKKRDQAMFDSLTQQDTGNAKGSIFNPKPTLVPHSTAVMSEDEKRKNATQTLGGGIKMIKGDNGTCFVERDLTSIGMDGLTSREGFNCGPSEFDKAFKSHMKKLKKKMGK